MTIAVLVDALNPMYLHYMPWLQKLQHSGSTGQLEETLGFTPREAYFGGLTPNETGHTHMFQRTTRQSPFDISRFMLDTPAERQRIKAMAQRNVPAFGGAYIDPLHIPLHLLREFDIAEPHAPWDVRKGYHSFFDELTRQGMHYKFLGWPFLSGQDSVACSMAKQQLTQCAFLFLHLTQLDATGHNYGPHSRQVLEAAQELDRRLAWLLDEQVGKAELLIFGDHGMVPVTFTNVAVPTELGKIPGLIYFIDSTTVRVWGDAAHREQAATVLDQDDSCVYLRPSQLRTYQAENVPNGDTYWARPGVIFAPNFFGNSSPRGMHGYLPEVSDNRGLLVAHGQALPPGTFSTPIQSWHIHSLLNRMVGWPERHPLPSIGTTTVALPPICKTIAHEIERQLPGLYAIEVAGSFGRNEGQLADGKPTNDIDFAIHTHPPYGRDDLQRLSASMAQQFDLPFVDINYPPIAAATTFYYDFRYGAQTVSGCIPHTLREHIASNEIPTVQFALHILNRMAGVLTITGASTQMYQSNQWCKLGCALGDYYLHQVGAYHHSYQHRLARISELFLPKLSEPLLLALKFAYTTKLTSSPLSFAEQSDLRLTLQPVIRKLNPYRLVGFRFPYRRYIKSWFTRQPLLASPLIYLGIQREFLRYPFTSLARKRLTAQWFQITH